MTSHRIPVRRPAVVDIAFAFASPCCGVARWAFAWLAAAVRPSAGAVFRQEQAERARMGAERLRLWGR